MPDSNQSSVTPPIQQAVQYASLSSPVAEEELNLLDLWRVLIRERWLIVLFTVFCTALAVYQALTATPIYRAEILLKSVTEESSDGLSAKYSGLASMAGINIGGSNSSTNINVAILKSRTFIESFLQDEKLLPALFAGAWDSASQNWKVTDTKQIPTMWQGVESFKNILSVSNNDGAGLITLAIEWHEREKTAQWANLLVERINNHLQKLAIQESKKSMEYLQIELSKTNIVELQQAIANLMEAQIKKIMLTKIQTDFAFKIIDRAVVPPENTFIRPKRRFMVVTGFVIGVFLGILAAFFRNFLRSIKK